MKTRKVTTRKNKRLYCPKNKVFTRQELKEFFKRFGHYDLQHLENYTINFFGNLQSPYAGDFLAIFMVTEGKIVEYFKSRRVEVLKSVFRSHGHFVLNDLTGIIEDKHDYIKRVGQVEWGIEIIQVKRNLWDSHIATPYGPEVLAAFQEAKEEVRQREEGIRQLG